MPAPRHSSSREQLAAGWRIGALSAAISLASLAFGACGGEAASEAADSTRPATSTTTTRAPPSTSTVPTTTAEAATTTQSTTTTTTIAPISAEQLARAEAIGDIDSGEALFFSPIEGVPRDEPCSTCHTFDGTDSHGPSLDGISQVAGERVEGLSDVEYLRQSIVEPSAVREGDWFAVMPYQYPDILSSDQIDDLVAFLMTR